MIDQIAETVKEERNQDLLALVNQMAIDKNELQVGTTQEVLCTGGSKKDPNRMTSRTSQNKIVIFDGKAERMSGKILPIKIERSSGFTLFGTPVIY
jgi:tRNA-2-methylthio-N6-dimethylallyladenosine synthase